MFVIDYYMVNDTIIRTIDRHRDVDCRLHTTCIARKDFFTPVWGERRRPLMSTAGLMLMLVRSIPLLRVSHEDIAAAP